MSQQDREDDEVAGRAALREELADELGMPLIAVVSGWQGNAVVNLDAEAARAFLTVLDDELEAHPKRPKSLALFLVGRGGFAGFADAVTRALEGRNLALHAVVPYRADGAFSLISLSAKRCLLHPYGALGAYDRRPLGRLAGEVDSELLNEVDLSAADVDADAFLLRSIGAERRQVRLARRLMERLAGGPDSKLAKRLSMQMSSEILGSDLALSAEELDEIGLKSKTATGDVAEALWALYLAYETELGILEPVIPRFTESQVADEVEFTPAVGLNGAFIEGSARQMRYEIDTGSPDPDTNMLTGEWIWGDRG